MSAAHRDLRRVLGSLAVHLDRQLDGLVAADRFTEGREALHRLAATATGAELDALPEPEAAWLAEELRRRWAAIGTVELEPIAWLEIEHGEAGEPGDPAPWLRARADGLEPGWTVSWTGAEPDPEGGTRARVVTEQVVARVMGRGPAGRVILAATWAAAVAAAAVTTELTTEPERLGPR